MVKVLNIISDKNIGGAGRVLLNYLKYSDKTRYETFAALPRGSLLTAPLEAAGAKVYELDVSADKSLDFPAVKKFRELIEIIDPDIVHTHGSMSGRIAGRRCGKKVIYTRHSVFPVSPRVKKGPGRLLNKLINEHYSDRIIAVSPAAKENLTDAGISDALIDIVMNGVEQVPRLSPGECMALRARYGIIEGEFAAGILARVEEYKGHMLILDAAKTLKDEGRNIKILVAGTGTYFDEVKKRTDELGLNDTVLLLGFVTDVASLLSILDVQLNASYGTEATSMSLLEGMSMGLPAIVSDYGGNPWLIEQEKTGLVFKTGDSAELADCLRRLMDSPGLLKNMSGIAVKTYESKYTGQLFAANIECVYARVLKGEPHGK